MIILNSTFTLDLEGYAITAVDSFVDALTTQKSSLICNMNYGTDWYKLKHRRFDSSWKIDARRYCKDACAFDDRLDFEDVKFSYLDGDTAKVIISVYISQKVIKMSINV